MPLFAFIASDGAGSMRNELLDAQDIDAVGKKLRSMGWKIIDAHEATQEERKQLPFLEIAPPSSTAPVLTLERDVRYAPIVETLRLYAGWILAWCGAVYLLGSFELAERIPFSIPFATELFGSTTMLFVAFGTYLFLLLTSIHTWMKGGILMGLLLTLLGSMMLWGFVMLA